MVKIQNVSNQVVPLVLPVSQGGANVSLSPRQSASFSIDQPTAQMKRLIHKGILKLKR